MRCEDARRDSERRGRGSRRVLARARPRGTARGWIVVGLALLVVVPGRAPAAECASSGLEPGVCAPLSGGLDPIPTEELERRLAFLERRLEAGRRNARLWQYGFTGAWSTGLALGNPSDAISSVGVGVLFGELMLWTQPGRGERDLADYRARLRRGRDASEAGRIELQIAPGPASLALRIRF